MKKEELFPLVDPQGRVVGTATRSYCHSGAKAIHPVVHLHVFNATGDLYLQQRSLLKDIQPDKWDTAVGGHIDPGEDPETAVRREAREELGIIGFEPKPILKYLFESEIERELVYSFTTTYQGTITPYSGELADGRFWKSVDIVAALGKGIFTPNFEQEYLRLQQSGIL